MQAQHLEAAKSAAKGYARAVKELSFKKFREMGAKIRIGFFVLEAAFL